MSKKKIIGIDINEVLRYRWIQFDRFYVEEFGDENIPEIPYVYDFWKDYKWEDKEETTNFLNEEVPEDISPLDYTVDAKTGEAPVDAFVFRPETKTIFARDIYKKFMYEDYLFEIHGSAPLMYKGLDRDLENLYDKFKHQFNFKIVSKENWFTIPPTLFFLSKCLPRIQKYDLVATNQEIWEGTDILITTDPELLVNVPKRKKVVKVLRPYNEKTKTDTKIEIFQILDLLGSKDFEKFVGYKKLNEDNKTKKN
jgi:hypothetical protein